MWRYVAVDSPGHVSLRDEEPQAPGPGEIQVESIVSGISAGTEMAVYLGRLSNLRTGRWGYWTDYPIRPGYQLVATVRRCGENVRDVRPGNRVVCHAPHATHAVVPYSNYVRVPDGLSDEHATFAMLGATVAHGLRRAPVDPGDSVLVLGLGVVGWLSAEYARHSGAGQVLVADPLEWKRAFAAERGCVSPVDPTRAEFERTVVERTGGKGVDLAIESSGNPHAIQAALLAVRRGGRILLLGTQTTPVQMDLSDYPMHKEVHFICTWGKGAVESPDRQEAAVAQPDTRKANQQHAMALIAEGRLRVEGLVTHRFPLEEIGRVYRLIADGHLDYLQIVLEY